ncbi:hypothetical protein MTBLM1_20223 [Rhodospirillaceae bacterium LM-1]|nr:hypothetical protein MTBLM1_20223 [Rhodospirillaceae bacterium LM-1]
MMRRMTRQKARILMAAMPFHHATLLGDRPVECRKAAGVCRPVASEMPLGGGAVKPKPQRACILATQQLTIQLFRSRDGPPRK